jgi:hypothetical protein
MDRYQDNLRLYLNLEDEGPASAEELCSRIFVTCYMGTVNSSEETRDRAKLLAEQVGVGFKM